MDIWRPCGRLLAYVEPYPLTPQRVCVGPWTDAVTCHLGPVARRKCISTQPPMTTPAASMPPGGDPSRTTEAAANPPGSAKKRKNKVPTTPIGTPGAPQEAVGTPSQTHSNKRKKLRQRMQADPSFPGFGMPGTDLGASAWQTIVAFRAPFGKAFDRVLDAGFTLDSVRRMVAEKYHISRDAPINLSYVAADGSHIDLDDNEDFRAFQVHAARESTITVHVHLPESSARAQAPAETHTPAQPNHGKGRGRRGRGGNRQEELQERGGTEDSASATEVSNLVNADKPTSDTPTTPAKQNRKRKADQPPNSHEQADTSDAPTPEDAAPAASASGSAPLSASNESEAPSDDDDDIPLSQSAPPSSQPPPSSQSDSPEKPKRSRRTKAEMEAFRAEKAAKKAAKEQARAEKSAGKATAETSTAADADASGAADETVIVHEARNEDHSAVASSAVQGLMSQGIDAMQQRLAELKAKKQRKNAVEREEQKMLVNMVKGTSATPSEADVSSRELPPNAQRAKTDARLISNERDLEQSSVAPPAASSEDADNSVSSTESREYFSQPESHANTSLSQVQGPSPRPSGPMESTPQRQRSGHDEDPSASTRHSMSGAFTKLSDLRPSALRRSFSRPENQSSAPADTTEQAPQTELEEQTEESDSSDDDDDDSSSDEEPPASQQSALPPSKLAGAGAEASATDASKAKKKRSFFSVLS